MILRLVKLTFRPEEVETFRQLFSRYQHAIRNQPGCTHLEAWQSIDQPEVFFTYSQWEDRSDLERYRKSEVFGEVWPQTKALFADKPQAWSVDRIARPQVLSYDIPINDSWTLLEEKIRGLKPDKIGILVDENTRRDCLPLLEKHFDTTDWHLIEIPSGESHKTLQTCQYIWSAMMEQQFSRKSLLINLGGGVIGDMGGFCAATFKRGMRFIQIPTTLLSQTDASVGGKLGIDFQDIKNSIGVFRDPEMVFIRTDFLDTLPFRELRSGFAEIVKHALIYDEELWQKLQKTEDLASAEWEEILPQALAVKTKVVLTDPFEKGQRKILNFGHTIGHAIESLLLNSDQPALHGEAVAAGMICETHLSQSLGLLSENDSQQIVTYIRKHFPDLQWKKNATDQLFELMAQDKKNEGDNIRFVLLDAIGHAVYDQSTDREVIEQALDQYLS